MRFYPLGDSLLSFGCQRSGTRRSPHGKNRSLPVALEIECLEDRRLLTDYFIDAANGDDANAGTEESPWRTYLNIVTYSSGTAEPAGHVDLQAGDAVRFAAGVYDATYELDPNDFRGLSLRNVHGDQGAPIRFIGEPGAKLLAAHPANESAVNPQDRISLSPVDFLQSSFLTLEGFEITSYGAAIRIAETNHVEIANNWIHDVDGVDNSADTGIYVVGASVVEIHHNLMHDNYDRNNTDTPGKTDGSVNSIFYSHGQIHFHHNEVFQSVPIDAERTGTGILASQQISQDGDGNDRSPFFEADHNVFRQVFSRTIETEGAGTGVQIHHNLIVNSGHIRVRNLEEPGPGGEIDIQYNTIVNLNPLEQNGAGFSGGMDVGGENGEPSPFHYADNIVVDARTYNVDRGIIEFSNYGSDEGYRQIVDGGLLSFGGNVYFNPNNPNPEDLRFNLFNADSRGALGEAYDFAGWEALDFVQGEIAEDPGLDAAFLPQNPDAEFAGWYAGEGPRLTLLVVGENHVQEGNATTLVLVRSGMDLSGALTVDLTSTDASEVSFPATVTIPAGQSSVMFQVTTNNDGEDDGTRAVRISASESTIDNSDNVDTWLRVGDDVPVSLGRLEADPITVGGGTSHVFRVEFDVPTGTPFTPPKLDVMGQGGTAVAATMIGQTQTPVPGSSMMIVTATYQIPAFGVEGLWNDADNGAMTVRMLDSTGNFLGNIGTFDVDIQNGIIVTGPEAGGGPHLKVFDPITNQVEFQMFAYNANFLGGVRVAVGDVNGDGTMDVITAPGRGGGPHIRVFDGKTMLPIRDFLAYDSLFIGGVFVASGDVNGDGFDDIITGAGAGAGPHVKVFSGQDGSELASFFAYSPAFVGGVTVAAGDFNGDELADIAVGTGAGGGPHVRVFDVSSGVFSVNPPDLFSFFAYSAGFSGGVFVSAADFNDDGVVELITSPGAGGGPHVRVFEVTPGSISIIHEFLAFDPGFTGGVRPAVVDFDGDARMDIVTAPGQNLGLPVDTRVEMTLPIAKTMDPYPGFQGGINVGGSPGKSRSGPGGNGGRQNVPGSSFDFSFREFASEEPGSELALTTSLEPASAASTPDESLPAAVFAFITAGQPTSLDQGNDEAFLEESAALLGVRFDEEGTMGQDAGLDPEYDDPNVELVVLPPRLETDPLPSAEEGLLAGLFSNHDLVSELLLAAP